MTISSSLNAGVSGLSVNASRLATISDNIANSGTYGYKRATSDFTALVFGQSGGSYSASGVRVTTGRDVQQRGTLITTGNATDLAIGGRGMLPVTPVTQVDREGDPLLQMTTTGSFRPDANGILRTDSGLALLGWPTLADGTLGDVPRDGPGGLVPVVVDGASLEGEPTTALTLGVNLPATDTAEGATGDPRTLSVDYYGNLGQTETLDITFTPTLPANPGDPATNAWTMVIEDRGQGAGAIATITIAFDDSRENGGTIAGGGVTGADAGDYDPATGILTVTTPSGPLAVEIGRPEEGGGLSQLSDTFAPLSIVKDGAPVGLLAGVEVDASGSLNAVYDNGSVRRLYQIPIVDVPNPNGLQALSNQSYRISGESGAYYLWDAGTGPVGEMIGFAREESAVDVAAELTQLITTQRAYNSNAKVIQTVDEMLQETANIKR